MALPCCGDSRCDGDFSVYVLLQATVAESQEGCSQNVLDPSQLENSWESSLEMTLHCSAGQGLQWHTQLPPSKALCASKDWSPLPPPHWIYSLVLIGTLSQVSTTDSCFILEGNYVCKVRVPGCVIKRRCRTGTASKFGRWLLYPVGRSKRNYVSLV